jgi:hypothetical protein
MSTAMWPAGLHPDIGTAWRNSVRVPNRADRFRVIGHNLAHRTCSANSGTESHCSASFRSGGLLFSILRRRVRFVGTEKASGDLGYFIDRSQKRALV